MEKQPSGQIDRRVLRSRAKIRSALFELVKEKPYAQISVTELTERAGLNRKTFYMHYASLDDVLSEVEEDFAAALSRVLADSSFYDTRKISSDMVYGVEAAVRENYEVLDCLSRARSFDVIRDRVERGVRDVIWRKLAQYSSLDDAGRPYISQYLAAGLVSMIVLWIRRVDGKPLEAVAPMAEQMIFYGISSLLPPEE